MVDIGEDLFAALLTESGMMSEGAQVSQQGSVNDLRTRIRNNHACPVGLSGNWAECSQEIRVERFLYRADLGEKETGIGLEGIDGHVDPVDADSVRSLLPSQAWESFLRNDRYLDPFGIQDCPEIVENGLFDLLE